MSVVVLNLNFDRFVIEHLYQLCIYKYLLVITNLDRSDDVASRNETLANKMCHLLGSYIYI